jgi:hypothetical protein
VLSVLSIYIVNILRGDTGVRMISQHRARFCMLILDKLQDRFPVVAAYYPIYESSLRRHSAGGQTQDVGVPECTGTGSSVQNGSRQLDNEGNLGSMDSTGGLFDQVPQDGMGMAFPFSFPFGNLFEDVFLNSSSRSIPYCEDDVSYP